MTVCSKCALPSIYTVSQVTSVASECSIDQTSSKRARYQIYDMDDGSICVVTERVEHRELLVAQTTATRGILLS